MQKHWWELGKNKAHDAVWSQFSHLENHDKARIHRYETYAKVYGGPSSDSVKPEDSGNTDFETLTGIPIRLNAAKAAVDTIVAKVGKLRPRPTFVTDGANYTLQSRARNLQLFIDGAFHQSDMYATSPGVFRNAMVFGTGVLHPYRMGKRLCTENVHPADIYVDRVEAINGMPRTLYRVHYMDRVKLAAMAEHTRGKMTASRVLEAPRVKNRAWALDDEEEGSDIPDMGGMVQVVEAFHLPDITEDTLDEIQMRTGKRPEIKDKGGRHIICIDGDTILDEEWCYDSFPFVFFHWSRPQRGFWGDSAIEEVAGLQVEINRIIRTAKKAFQLCGNPFWWVPASAGVDVDKLTNELGLKVVGGGGEGRPELVTFKPLDHQILDHMWQLYSKCFEILGSNQLAAAATAPAGLESGRALEKLSEEHTERFMTVSRDFEHAVGELSTRQYLRLAKEIDQNMRDAGMGSFRIKAGEGREFFDISWDEVSMDSDSYFIKVFPASSLPTTPALRAAELERYQNSGWIDKTTALRLLDMPDLVEETNLNTSGQRLLFKQIEAMLEHGEPEAPEPYQNHQEALSICQNAILQARIKGVDAGNIDLLRDFITALEAFIAAAQPPAPEPGAMGGPPEGSAVAPPAPTAPAPAPTMGA